MPLRNARPINFRPRGLSDALDATNGFTGSMKQLINLIPAPQNPGCFTMRPASVLKTSFGGFNTPAGITALFVVGNRAYGMISSADFAGKDVPFCYDIAGAAFVAISGELSANLPATVSTAGDWQPPKMAMISNTRIIVTHPGFAGGAGSYFGWLDISGFHSTGITGDTHVGTAIIDNLSSNPITAGWEPGMKIAGANIPANTTIKTLTATQVTVTNNSTGSTAGVALTVDGGTFAAPLWGSGNTNTNPLASVPLSVEQFNGRAWYAVANAVVFSDALLPCQVTNASQALICGDSENVTALAPLGLSSNIQGGIVQSLLVFKGDSSLFQITGDQATANLILNANPVNVGTLAPNTICQTPKGVAFVSGDGLRIIDNNAKVGDPVGAYGQGVNAPFLAAVSPSRMTAAFNQNVYRVTVQNGAAQGSPYEEYWLDFSIGIWTGPHTFPASMIEAFQGSPHGFIMAAQGVDAKLWTSNVGTLSTDTYVENGNAMTWAYQTSLLPDNEQAAMNAVVDMTIAMAAGAGTVLTIEAIDENNNDIDNVQFVVPTPGAGVAIWNAFNWGGGIWGQLIGLLKQYRIPWAKPIVFKQMFFRVTGPSSFGTIIGNLYINRQILGYLIPP